MAGSSSNPQMAFLPAAAGEEEAPATLALLVIAGSIPYNCEHWDMLTLTNFMVTLGRLFTFQILSGSQLRYSLVEGFNPRDPGYYRWELALKEEKQEPRTEAEKLLPPVVYKIILRDKFGMRLDDVFFFSKDKKRVDACLEKLSEELRCRTAADFYGMWVVNRNLDFLAGVEEKIEFEEA